MNPSRTWFTTTAIQEAHKDFPIKQIYLWFITKDKKIPIVRGRKGKFQLPGGKPESNETEFETIKREMFEETGISIDLDNYEPKLFGYYLIENDETFNLKSYLQIRYILNVEEQSDQIRLSVNEKENDIDKMEIAKFIDINHLGKYLPYLENGDEYVAVQNNIL